LVLDRRTVLIVTAGLPGAGTSTTGAVPRITLDSVQALGVKVERALAFLDV